MAAAQAEAKAPGGGEKAEAVAAVRSHPMAFGISGSRAANLFNPGPACHGIQHWFA